MHCSQAKHTLVHQYISCVRAGWGGNCVFALIRSSPDMATSCRGGIWTHRRALVWPNTSESQWRSGVFQFDCTCNRDGLSGSVGQFARVVWMSKRFTTTSTHTHTHTPLHYFVQWPTNTQLFHKLSHCYMFRHYRVILRQPVINTLPSYTNISNAAVGNTVYN